MITRDDIEKLLRETYAARQRGDLDGICRAFAPDGRFQMAGSNASPVAVRVEGCEQYRPLLAGMIKTFEISDYSIPNMLIEGDKAAVHWRAEMRSAITGQTVETELLDLIEIEIENGRITSFPGIL
ncbi:MAG: nuclear transport factor 2 family protein [Hyphomicrobiales bacterium]|nr:nuclear transport factor 2 family protein [Hyphomicrobiales bacterium]